MSEAKAINNKSDTTNGTSEATAAIKANSFKMKADARQVPSWLKGDLFVDVLRKTVPEFKSIRNFSVQPAQSAGENYATLMTLVQIEMVLESNKTKSISYMLKLPIEAVQSALKGHNIFDTETAMYRDVIPEMEQLYRDAGAEVRFGPEYYELQTPSEAGVILMEDLRQRNFKNANRLEGFDMEHTKCTLKKLAQWHAASAVRVETKGKYPKKIVMGIYNEEFIETMKTVNEPIMHLLQECVSTYDGHEAYIDSLCKSQARMFEEFRSVMKPDPNDFNVLNHGDFWANNIMFKYDAFGKIKETYFVDFQCPRYGPPVYDLYSLLISSTQYEIKLKHFEYFIKFYHDHLIESLKLLKYPKRMPTLKEIHMALYKYGIWGFLTASGHMAIVLLDPTDTANFDNLLSNSQEGIEFRRLMYTNKRYRKHAEAVLPWLHYRGAFE